MQKIKYKPPGYIKEYKMAVVPQTAIITSYCANGNLITGKWIKWQAMHGFMAVAIDIESISYKTRNDVRVVPSQDP